MPCLSVGKASRLSHPTPATCGRKSFSKIRSRPRSV
nr:MAG TPA: hypothetical protein [Caudoviricetes sp.]